jgi:hypothetical protein
VSNPPPQLAAACCVHESDPAGHSTSVVGRPSDRKSGALLLQPPNAAPAASASIAPVPRARKEKLRFM